VTFDGAVRKVVASVERVIILVLLGMLMLLVLYGTWVLTAELLARMWERVGSAQPVSIQATEDFLQRMDLLRHVFGAFMLILIGIELIKTIVMYLDDHELHVEVVFTVSMIAVARHAIELDIAHAQPLTLLGTSALILALTAGYFLYRRASALSPLPGRKS
jgi:uncharacterized membrane protein (DUF373 family)